MEDVETMTFESLTQKKHSVKNGNIIGMQNWKIIIKRRSLMANNDYHRS